MFLQGGVNMQVFKTFMKILKTRLTSALLYLVIFMVIAVIMADTAKITMTMRTIKCPYPSLTVTTVPKASVCRTLYSATTKGGACR